MRLLGLWVMLMEDVDDGGELLQGEDLFKGTLSKSFFADSAALVFPSPFDAAVA
ncbi:MAG: hypothetical protein AB7S56_06275 [Halothiobacillaceae bacterium]